MTLRPLISGLLALLGLCLGAHALPHAHEPLRAGQGWTMTRLDLELWVLPGEGRLRMQGSLDLRLDALSSSSGPDLLLNRQLTADGVPVMRFEQVSCEGAEAKLQSALRGNAMRQARIRFQRPKRRGESIEVRFSASSEGLASQLIVTEEAALASWTSGWHPFTNPLRTSGLRFNNGVLHAPGRTKLHLPAGWVGIVDGSLVERTQTASETIEVWETPEGIARGFAAGPFKITTGSAGQREVKIYTLTEGKVIGPQRLLRLIAATMAAQVARFGPFPFASYAVVEMPDDLPQQTWAAASQQSFIVARSRHFDHENGNLALWGHEMSHAWWGNTVGTGGPGSLLCDEALAGLGALIAIETIEGAESLREFMAFSREGWSPVNCAAGYFLFLGKGQDLKLSSMSQANPADDLADSKGVWVYHMLRQVVGDELFFGVLRELIEDYAQRNVTLREVRKRFIAAAPEHDLKTFFAQWLDRKGAPIFDVDWFAKLDRRGLVLQLTQVQDGKPFAFELDLELELADGQRVIERVAIKDKSHRFLFKTPGRPTQVRLDPEGKLLLWRPSYGPRPGDDYQAGPVAPKALASAVVGTYREREGSKDIVVFQRDGALLLQPTGAPAFHLLFEGDGAFRLDVPGEPMVVHFDLSASPAPLLWGLEGKRKYFADRVKR